MRSPTVQEASRWIGRVLRDKWRIDSRIARGGVGTVWAATHKNNGNHVAIKILHPEFSRDPDTRSRFLQEGYAANQVNHPGVVRILDDDMTEEGQAFLVMELLEGELLEKRRTRKGGRVPLPEVYEIGDQLLDVLAAAHEKGIVHRDVKPDNLFLTKQGRLKVLDFGFAQMKSGFRREQTATGFLLGTPGFMSPEQAVGNRAQVDAKTDIWAVGATLYTLVSGRPVHEGESAAELLVAAANYPARPLLSVEPSTPPPLAKVIDRALAFEKSARWANARQMQGALRAAMVTRGPMPSFLPTGEHGLPQLHDSVEGEGDKTVMAKYEELDSSELEEHKPSWQSDQRTLIADVRHPADDEKATLAVRSPAEDEPATAPPMTPPMHNRPPSLSSMIDDSEGGTQIMAAGTGQNPVYRSGQHAAVQPPKFGTATIKMNTPQALQVAQMPPPSRPDDMMFVAGPARPAHGPTPGTHKLLVFVGVVLFSMVVVVVTGLLVLAATE